MPLTSLLIVVVALAVAVGAFSQSVTGIGFSLVVVPACALLLPDAQVVGTVALLGAVMDLGVLAGAHHEVDWREVARLAGAGLCALPVGMVLIRVLPLRLVVVLGAVATLGAAAAVVLRGRRPARRRPLVGVGPSTSSETTSAVEGTSGPAPGTATPAGTATASGTAGVGFAAGVLGLTSGLCGPPVALYTVLTGRSMSSSRGTLAAFFFVVDLVAAVLHPHTIGFMPLASLMIAGAVGIAVGMRARLRLTEATVRSAVLGLVMICAFGAMIHSLW